MSESTDHAKVLAEHSVRTQRIASQVQSFYNRQQSFRIYHGSTSSTRRNVYDPKKVIDTSDLSNVLYIDVENRIGLIEPNVSMEKLVDATLPLQLVPLVVMEFPSITVGGGFSGTSGESSSFRQGVFDNTVGRIEIVLGNGEVVYASPSENPDLYHGSAGSFGTMGVVTLLEVRLVDAKPLVELEYSPVSGIPEAVQAVDAYTADTDIQYLDGIMFSKLSGVIIAGRMVEPTKSQSGLRIQRYSRSWDPWFYLRAEEITVEIAEKTFRELVPLKDYLFRYDRGAFWGGKFCFQYFLTPFNRFTRWALDSLLHTKTMYSALHRSGLANENIVQDIGFPYESVPAFVEYLDRDFGLYPLWLCPLRMREPISLSPRLAPYKALNGRDGKLLNIGLWGPGPRNHVGFVNANRRIEAKTKELGGLKCLYAHSYYTEDEFWSIYDKTRYDQLRNKYHAALIPSIFHKATTNDKSTSDASMSQYIKTIWPIRGLYGALSVLLSPRNRDPSITWPGVLLILSLSPIILIMIVGSLAAKVWSILLIANSRKLHQS